MPPSDMDRPLFNTFGTLLKSLRKERKLTQQELADLAGVERNYIYYLEKGRSQPTLPVLMNLAGALGLSLSQMALLIEQAIRER